MSRDLRPEESVAIYDLHDGKLEALADLLEQENDDFHPDVQRYLWRLIRGTIHDTDFRLKVTRHPDIPGNQPANGIRATRLREQSGGWIAIEMARNGAFDPGCHDSALSQTMEQTGLSKSTIEKHWSKNKGDAAFLMEEGFMKKRD